MSESGSRRGRGQGRGRTHDAEGAQEAILNAAEKVFAEHGFDGARIDAIAAEAGYNKSLIFHYFGDKLNLYTAVLQRIDRMASEFQAQALAPLLADEHLTSDPDKFKAFLSTAYRFLFDFLLERPYLLRMIAWEAAEGWQTLRKISSLFSSEDFQLFRQLMKKAQDAGMIRPGVDPYMTFFITFMTSMSYLTFAPMLEIAFEGEDLLSPDALARARETIVDLAIRGMLVDPQEAKP
ncbi:MAG: TetR family transcriptional regulator [Ktedonobacteraceae bacterium]|nr:TetR family transcriptional regulator [Ktedonobacteraceae bacterium]